MGMNFIRKNELVFGATLSAIASIRYCFLRDEKHNVGGQDAYDHTS